MKTLDSLAALLLLSSAIMADTAAQSTVKQADLENTVQRFATTANDSVARVDLPSPGRSKNVKSQKGTVTASRLIWSGKDHEVYFKGDIRVNFGENHFIAKGTVNFLGPVHLLIVFDAEATPDAPVELNEKEYQLTMLNSQEATRKYGDKGRQGAVEIARIE